MEVGVPNWRGAGTPGERRGGGGALQAALWVLPAEI